MEDSLFDKEHYGDLNNIEDLEEEINFNAFIKGIPMLAKAHATYFIECLERTEDVPTAMELSKQWLMLITKINKNDEGGE